MVNDLPAQIVTSVEATVTVGWVAFTVTPDTALVALTQPAELVPVTE